MRLSRTKGQRMFKQIVLSGLIGINSFLYANNLDVIVSILPQKTFVEKIGGNRVNVTAMVKPGSNPHSYEPKASQMKALSRAKVYFPIKLEFENVWLEKFAQQNQKMQFSDMTQGINHIEMLEHTHSHKNLKKNDITPILSKSEVTEEIDPHTWTSPSNVKIMAKNIYNTLVEIDSKNQVYYQKNYEDFLEEITQTDEKIKKILSSLPKKSKIMVFHPSWGYFAKEYGLIQVAIEVEGKEPKPRMLEKIIKKAREEGVKVLFAQKEFSDKSAKAIARELNIKVLKETPLAEDWSANLIKMADAIANNN